MKFNYINFQSGSVNFFEASQEIKAQVKPITEPYDFWVLK